MVEWTEKMENERLNPTVVDWARLAAFIDGEGTIYINCQRPKNRGPRHFLSVMITNTNPVLMTWLTSLFGGTVYSVKPTLGRKPIFRWQMNEKLAEVILVGCLPYFILKRQHAEVGLAFRELKKKQRYNGRRLPPEVLSARDDLAAKIRSLNHSATAPIN